MKIQISDILHIFGDTVSLLENCFFFYFVKNAAKKRLSRRTVFKELLQFSKACYILDSSFL